MGSVVLFICGCRLVLYSAGSGVNSLHVLSGFFCPNFIHLLQVV